MSINSEIQNKVNTVIELIEARYAYPNPDAPLPSRPYIIAIDGRCGSGKTTLAEALKRKLENSQPHIKIELFHMDDFYLRPSQRTEERFALPGGNVDHERFLSDVLTKIIRSEEFSYRPFDCASFTLSEPINVKPCHIALIEGSYSLHPQLCDHYDLKVFLSISPEEQRQRILIRNGKEKLEQFVNRWIPFEELYFNCCGVRDSADLVIDMRFPVE